MTLASPRRPAAGGEGPTLEFRRSTGELREGLETVCAFLNTTGGRVLFGVNRKRQLEGQQASEQTSTPADLCEVDKPLQEEGIADELGGDVLEDLCLLGRDGLAGMGRESSPS